MAGRYLVTPVRGDRPPAAWIVIAFVPGAIVAAVLDVALFWELFATPGLVGRTVVDVLSAFSGGVVVGLVLFRRPEPSVRAQRAISRVGSAAALVGVSFAFLGRFAADRLNGSGPELQLSAELPLMVVAAAVGGALGVLATARAGRLMEARR